MKFTTIVGYLVSGVLLALAVLYALASAYNPTRLITSGLLFLAGFVILFVTWRAQPTQIVQKLEVSGTMKAQPIKCPNCSASIDAKQMQIVKGVPMATCPYCGHTFEVVEEPKW